MSKLRSWISLALLVASFALPHAGNAQTTRVQERDPAVTYTSSNWYDIPDPGWSDGEALGAFEAGATMTVNFSGTALTWIGYRCACAAGTARVYIDGQLHGTVNTYAAQPELQAEIYTVEGLSAGQHSFRIEHTGTYHSSGTSAYILVDAFDIDGSGATSPSDTVAPQVTLAAPAAGSLVSGVVTVNVNATDDSWVQDVRLMVDGAPTGLVDSAAPYSFQWNTTDLADGPHELTAMATDTAGNTAEDTITVQVSNDGFIQENDSAITYTGEWYDLSAPDVSGGSVVGTFHRGATATVNFNGTGIAWIGYRCPCAAGIARVYVDGNLAGTVDTYASGREAQAEVFSTSGLPSGQHVLRIEHTGSYNRSGDSAYLIIDAFRVTAGSGGGGDTQAPEINITAPAADATVSGVVAINAEAQDDVGVAGVQFFVDGNPLGTEDTSAPYAVSWDTTDASEGTHVITARARDSAGNTTLSSARTVTVQHESDPSEPDTVPPTASITAPAPGAVISGTFDVTANASDNVAIANVSFWRPYQQGLVRMGDDTTAPYSYSWDTTAMTDGEHSLSLLAVDTSGNYSAPDGGREPHGMVNFIIDNSVVPGRTRIDDANSAIVYTGNWELQQDGREAPYFHWGFAHIARSPGARATYTFSGTRVRWIGPRCFECGQASVSIDGGPATTVVTQDSGALGNPAESVHVLYESPVLASGTHTIEITAGEPLSPSNPGWILIDAFEVLDAADAQP